MKRINCFKCKKFILTYDTKMPYSCKEFGFKGAQMPSITVRNTLKQPCPAFEDKTQKKEE